MADQPRSKTVTIMKFAICVGIGLALGIVFRDFNPAGVPAMAIGPALGVLVGSVWTKPEREAAARPH